MTARTVELLTEVRNLPADDREELMVALLNDPAPPESDIDRMGNDELEAELLRRADEARRDPNVLIPWDEVKKM